MKLLLYISLLLGIIALFAAELLIGSVEIPPEAVLSMMISNESLSDSWQMIVIESRLPRALAAIVAGAALSVSGLMMQTLFRNPLAGPHILGISSGASLGVAILMLGFSSFGVSTYMLGIKLTLILAAFLGAFIVLMALFAISLRIRDLMTVLIFGILIGSISLAVVGILQYLSPDAQLKSFLIWTLGSFDGVELVDAKIMALIVAIVLILAIPLTKALNLLLTGEDYAQSMGLNVKRSRLWIMIVSGALTAVVTAFCGPIGFVGVVVPHFCRMMFKTFEHGQLILTSILTGILVMLFADLAAHLPWSDLILPINSITSLIGIPFIFWMLIRRKVITS